MSKETPIKLFNESQIRTHWDEEEEKWYLSIVDVVGVLAASVDPQAYWRKLKQRLKAEGNETVTSCHGLKMTPADGNMTNLELVLNILAEATTTEISMKPSPLLMHKF